MATQSFPAPTHFIFQSVGDFEHTKHKMVPQARANIFICLLDHTYEAPSDHREFVSQPKDQTRGAIAKIVN